MNQRECAGRIASDLRNLGILPGQTVLVHSSFKAMGPVPGGLETVLRGLLDALGDAGTLLMPALSLRIKPPQAFDVRRTPASIGALPEYFRTRPGTLRSLHPTHSVCAVGPRARGLLAHHHLDRTPCGPHSPFRKLAESEGRIIMLGCGLRPNTTMHALEEYTAPPYLFGPPCVYTLKDHEGRTHRRQYSTHGFTLQGYAQRYDRVAGLAPNPVVAGGSVLQAPTHILDAPTLKAAVLKALEANPLFFVDAE